MRIRTIGKTTIKYLSNGNKVVYGDSLTSYCNCKLIKAKDTKFKTLELYEHPIFFRLEVSALGKIIKRHTKYKKEKV